MDFPAGSLREDFEEGSGRSSLGSLWPRDSAQLLEAVDTAARDTCANGNLDELSDLIEAEAGDADKEIDELTVTGEVNMAAGSTCAGWGGRPAPPVLSTWALTSVGDVLAPLACQWTWADAAHLSSGLSHTALALAATGARSGASCVMVVFAANDMRTHDNYCLSLAALRAEEAGGIPVVAVAVVDYRCFAQPSAIGGFFRQSPQRAEFFLGTLRALRKKLEVELKIPLLIRCGRPEDHVPRLALELGATDVFLTTQYAPHEKQVHDLIMARLKRGEWVAESPGSAEDGCTGTVQVCSIHDGRHPLAREQRRLTSPEPVVPHSVWQTTLVHIDDLPTPVSHMKEGERWYHDDVTVATIRPTHAYNDIIFGVSPGQLSGTSANPTAGRSRLMALPKRHELLPSELECRGLEATPSFRGSIPSLHDLGYRHARAGFYLEEAVATQSSHTPGEDHAIERAEEWLREGGMTSMLRTGRDRHTNMQMYSQKLSRLSPYLSNGSLSPRTLYEVVRKHTYDQLRDGFVQMQYREMLLRLSRRDYWHWMGLKYGASMFFSYGPRPADTSDVADWRHDEKIINRWCWGLTGIPFADACMRELLLTGFVGFEGRKALAWLLSCGYGQDWRIGAEWMERCSLDFDPFICYGNYAYYMGLVKDDFGEPVRNILYLAHQHDQTGIYIKKWLPQLSRIPPVYIHRPHVLTARMQKALQVSLGHNYCYPIKLWDGAQDTLTGEDLTTYFSPKTPTELAAQQTKLGYAEALRIAALATAAPSHGERSSLPSAVLVPALERHLAISEAYLAHRPCKEVVLQVEILAHDDDMAMEPLRRSGANHAPAAQPHLAKRVAFAHDNE